MGSKVSYWNNSSYPYEIDMRQEMIDFLHGNHSKGIIPRGRFVLLRRMDLRRKSKYYRQDSKETIGGPKWEYTDEIWKTYNVENYMSGIPTTIMGHFEIPLGVMFFEYKAHPKKQDEIYDISLDDNGNPLLINGKPQLIKRYGIIQCIPMREQASGRIEFYSVKTQREVIKY